MIDLAKLLQGFGRFRENRFEDERDLFRRLSEEGQTPKVLVLGCCDSRVDPAIILDSAPGDLYVIRNIANLVPPYEEAGHYHGTSAALEFGVCNLEVEHVIVLGHAHCGGIRALLESPLKMQEKSFVTGWMALAEEARAVVAKKLPHASPDELACACEKQAILTSLDNLLTFPWIRTRVESGKLALHGWYFDMDNGTLLGNAADGFAPLTVKSQ